MTELKHKPNKESEGMCVLGTSGVLVKASKPLNAQPQDKRISWTLRKPPVLFSFVFHCRKRTESIDKDTAGGPKKGNPHMGWGGPGCSLM